MTSPYTPSKPVPSKSVPRTTKIDPLKIKKITSIIESKVASIQKTLNGTMKDNKATLVANEETARNKVIELQNQIDNLS